MPIQAYLTYSDATNTILHRLLFKCRPHHLHSFFALTPHFDIPTQEKRHFFASKFGHIKNFYYLCTRNG